LTSLTGIFFARSAVGASIAPELTIVCNTTARRASARSRLPVGAYADGDWISPASSAASSTVRSEALFPR
jgi:hypothetical protein